MRNSSHYMTILMVLIVASLFGFVGCSVFPSSGSVAAAALFQEATPTPTLAPILTIVKEVEATLVNDLDRDGVIDPGDTIRYSIAYENIGGGEGTKVTIVDDYDQSFLASMANISADGVDDGNTITWDLHTVAAGASGSVTYDATLKSSFPTGSTDVTNMATISSAETAPASSTKPVTVEGPSLTINK